jgi:hypothetical protein
VHPAPQPVRTTQAKQTQQADVPVGCFGGWGWRGGGGGGGGWRGRGGGRGVRHMEVEPHHTLAGASSHAILFLYTCSRQAELL